MNTSMVEKVNSYIDHKLGLGYIYRTESFMLRSFANYADQYAPGKPLTIKLALEWATQPQTKSETYHAKRLDALRAFARHQATFEPDIEIPPGKILGPSCSRVSPHIYTNEETIALMRAALSIKPLALCAKTNPVRNATLIGLLACTGMRVGEVLALKNKDVDLADGIITVRESKSMPMRLVPIMECTVRKLLQYQEARDQCFGQAHESGAFFRSSWDRPLSYASFLVGFGSILERAGLNNKEASGRQPRIHDFRHTFACNHLLRAYRKNRNIDDAVHELSVYLGHANLQSTYWYLTGIPVLFEQCVMRFESQSISRRNGVKR